MEISKIFTFESAHFLPFFPEGHKCRRLHGHSFRLQTYIKGELQKGILMDYGEIKRVVKPFVDMLDHRLINEVGQEINSPLLQNPTSENLALWFAQVLTPILPQLSAIRIHETCTTECFLRLK
ncbi:MAG: 6-carboxytetrahydropterin synthase [Bacteroidia bacterium]|nr:6-carboxytetrahydropterin synthase [Bacteroidia bacterium]MDW8159421.1 6-carboxytetrahydropterin synthase [Bacteroidia bacterium]